MAVTFLDPPPIAGLEDAPLAQGPEGIELRALLLELVRHWTLPATAHAQVAEYQSLDDYQPVPLRPGKTVRVRYRVRGRLPPGKFPLDE